MTDGIDDHTPPGGAEDLVPPEGEAAQAEKGPGPGQREPEAATAPVESFETEVEQPAKVPILVTPPGSQTSATRRPATRRAPGRSTARKAPAATTKKATASIVPTIEPPLRPTTLAIDIGGTGLKASVLDAAGKLVADRVRVATPYPCTTKVMLKALVSLVAPLPSFDRISAGFPGVVREGRVLTAPHFVTKTGAPGEAVVAKLRDEWTGFDIASALSQSLGHPVRVANDADLQGLDVVSGSGLEFVVTLGTGVGTALFLDGKLAPHLELAHHPFRRGQTYDEQLGDATLRRIGQKKWRKRLEEAIVNFQVLLSYDRLYIGGGNARLLVGHIDDSVTIVDNLAGILGGIKLWEIPEH